MRYFKKYQQNLKYDNNFVYSYNTKVAEISYAEGQWNVGGKTSSPTTSRHINYASRELELDIVEFNFC